MSVAAPMRTGPPEHHCGDGSEARLRALRCGRGACRGDGVRRPCPDREQRARADSWWVAIYTCDPWLCPLLVFPQAWGALWVSPHMHEPGHVKAALADAIRSLAPFEDLANGLPTGAMEKIEATAEPGSGQAVFRSIVICRRGGAPQGGGTPAFVRRSPSGIRA